VGLKLGFDLLAFVVEVGEAARRRWPTAENNDGATGE
jgi:hypothetical protein